MDCFSLPVRYQQLTETDVQAHLRYCASSLTHGDRVEFLLYEAGVVIPIVKHIYRRKNPTLNVLIRSGSLGRDTLAKLRDSLSLEGYVLKVSLTSKRKLVSRIIVPLQIDDGTGAVTGLNVLRSIASALSIHWPSTVAVGYALGPETRGLPGRLTYRDPFMNAGYQVGQAVGKVIRKVIL